MNKNIFAPVGIATAVVLGMAGLSACGDEDFSKRCKKENGVVMQESDAEAQNIEGAAFVAGRGGGKGKSSSNSGSSTDNSDSDRKSKKNSKTSKQNSSGMNSKPKPKKPKNKSNDNELVCVKNGEVIFEEN